jgi:hypothetical protein
VSYETASVLVAHEYERSCCRPATTAPVATRGCAEVCTIGPDKAIATLAARCRRCMTAGTDRPACCQFSMRRRFTPVRPASPFHGGPTCVAVSRRSDLRRRFTAPDPSAIADVGSADAGAHCEASPRTRRAVTGTVGVHLWSGATSHHRRAVQVGPNAPSVDREALGFEHSPRLTVAWWRRSGVRSFPGSSAARAPGCCAAGSAASRA